MAKKEYEEEKTRQSNQPGKNTNTEPPTENTGGGEATGENTGETSMIIAKAKERFPESEFNSDQEALDAILADRDEIKEWQDKEMQANDEIRKAFEAEPKVGKLVKMVTQGAGLREALAYIMDDQELNSLVPAEEEPDYEAWEKNRKTRMEEVEKEQKEDEEFENNIAATEENIQAFAEEQGMDEEQAKGFADFISQTVQEVLSGNISKETMALLQKGQKYDEELAEKQKVDEVKQKNEQIDEEKKAQGADDGVPKLSSKGGAKQSEGKPEPKKTPFDEGVEAYEERRRI